MVKCMKILGNSVWGLNPHKKCLLYRSCILLIALYGFQLWYYNNAPVKIVDDGLYFYFLVSFYFIFLFLEQLRLGFISHTVTSVTT